MTFNNGACCLLATTLLLSQSLAIAQTPSCKEADLQQDSERVAEGHDDYRVDEGRGCWASARTQVERDHCASGDFIRADKELNDTYNKLLRKHRQQPLVIGALRKAQQAWIRFRDAYVKSLYPILSPREAQTEYGSSLSECELMHKTELTLQRVHQLKAMLNPDTTRACFFVH